MEAMEDGVIGAFEREREAMGCQFFFFFFG
jgi:hypothetical protein